MTSRLDVAKALLYRIPYKQIQQLQGLQNWTARLVVGATKFCRVTPLLRELHWLPIAVRVEFKTPLLVHRALNGRAPDYVANYVSRRLPPRSLRSSELYLLCVPRAKRIWGDRPFGIAAPTLWNLLPQHLSLTGLSEDVFKAQLNTYLKNNIYNILNILYGAMNNDS